VGGQGDFFPASCCGLGCGTLSERWSEVGQPQKPSPPSTRIFFLPLSAIISSTPARLVVVVLLGVLSMLLRASMLPGTTAGETLERRPEREMLGRETSGEGAIKPSATPMAERKARAAAAGVGTYIVVNFSFFEVETRCSCPSRRFGDKQQDTESRGRLVKQNARFRRTVEFETDND
jgi:hypothetical protein